MKNYIYLIGLIPIYFLISCKSVKTDIKTETIIQVDTFRDYKVITNYKAIRDTLIVDNPCDSNGILSNFYSKLILPFGKVIIRSKNQSIEATIDTDSISQVYQSKYANQYKNITKTEYKEIEKPYIPKWLIITLLIETIVIIGYLYFKFVKPI